MFLRVLPNCSSSPTEPQNPLQWPHRDLVTKYALKDMVNYHRSISNLITYDLIDITNSPLLSLDTIIHSETGRNRRNYMGADIHHRPQFLEFLYKFWTMTKYGYQKVAHCLSTRTAEDRYGGGLERENWDGTGKAFKNLLEAMRSRVEADILPDSAVLGCWCMVTDYLWFDTSPVGIIVIHVEILVER